MVVYVTEVLKCEKKNKYKKPTAAPTGHRPLGRPPPSPAQRPAATAPDVREQIPDLHLPIRDGEVPEGQPGPRDGRGRPDGPLGGGHARQYLGLIGILCSVTFGRAGSRGKRDQTSTGVSALLHRKRNA